MNDHLISHPDSILLTTPPPPLKKKEVHFSLPVLPQGFPGSLIIYTFNPLYRMFDWVSQRFLSLNGSQSEGAQLRIV